ncbi:spore germination protein [Alkalihalobacillus sp. 1P02AB]|uniref:spore germination protein n=1 Tax=Alkalihalobacillus sp. 1P02AB TaxID=3132260 RepID=UPI0039A656C2
MNGNSQDIQLKQFEQSLQSGKLHEKEIKDFFHLNADISFFPVQDPHFTAFYSEGMIDVTQLNDYMNRVMSHLIDSDERSGDLPPIAVIKDTEKMIEKVFSGYLILHKGPDSHFYSVNIAKVPQRNTEESKTEIALKGSRDGFIEDININIALLRKRLKSEKLNNETFELGSLSQTKVSLLYLRHKADKGTIDEVRKRLNQLDIESILSTGQLEQWISDRTYSLFPLFDYITRPDFAVESLLRGRFLIIVDGSPSILIGPINLLALLKSPEDVHYPFYFVTLQRMMRILGLHIAIFIPALYIAIANVNIDQLPFPLLATIVVSRHGIPFSLPLEAFLILILFELIREAGIRMPTAVGQTISIVGGLIIGDAAIRAGLTSPTLLVVMAVAAVATYTLVNQSLTGSVTILRIYCMLLATFLGVYGFVISCLSIIIYLAQLESFKVAYLEPIASLRFKEYLAALVTDPLKRKYFDSTIPKKSRR